MINRRVYHLLLRPAQHADGTDIIGVFSQSPLSFDPLSHGLRDIYWLQQRRDKDGEQETGVRKSSIY